MNQNLAAREYSCLPAQRQRAPLVKSPIAAFVTAASGRQTFVLAKSAYAYTLCLHPTVVFAHNYETT
jgi:hypothetical protein